MLSILKKIHQAKKIDHFLSCHLLKKIKKTKLPVVNGGRTFHTVAQYNIVICDRDSFLFSRDIGELTFCVMDQIRLEY